MSPESFVSCNFLASIFLDSPGAAPPRTKRWQELSDLSPECCAEPPPVPVFWLSEPETESKGAQNDKDSDRIYSGNVGTDGRDR